MSKTRKAKTGIDEGFDREDLLRLEDAFGEIAQHLPTLRASSGSEEWICVAEATIEGLAIVRRGLGRCFNSDLGPPDYSEQDGARGSEAEA